MSRVIRNTADNLTAADKLLPEITTKMTEMSAIHDLLSPTLDIALVAKIHSHCWKEHLKLAKFQCCMLYKIAQIYG